MEVMIETCCGIDVHQKSVVCCILDGPLDTYKTKENSEEIWDNYCISSKCPSLDGRKSCHTCLFCKH